MKVFIETLGCPKNINDSQKVAALLSRTGHDIAYNIDDANAIMINTCGFINDAKAESIDMILEMAELRDKKLIVTGCLSQRYSDELFELMPEVDVMLGVNDYYRLPRILSDMEAEEGLEKGRDGGSNPNRRIIHTDDYSRLSDIEGRLLSENTHTATVKISEGCDNRCTYCIIPNIRGSYRQRSKQDILREVNQIVDEGVKEIILIGQDVTAYGGLPELIREIASIEDVKWIRLMYCYEEGISDELIEVMADEAKVCKYIDIPLQHINDNILKRMNRKSTAEGIKQKILKLRKHIPDIAIRSTLIVGFPGETEQEFEELLSFVEEQRLDRLGVFKYSQEEGTPAANMPDQIEEDIKEMRFDAVMRAQLEISLERNQSFLGRILDVIVEERESSGVYVGRTQYDAPQIDCSVIFTSQDEVEIGDIVKVKIEDAFDYDLSGILVS